MEYLYIPAARASEMSTQALTDGELGRTEFYGEKYPELIRIPEPHMVVNFAAYTTLAGISRFDWQSLNNQNRSIVYLRGIDKLERRMRSLHAPHQHPINSELLGLRMLVNGRADVLIGPEPGVDKLLGRKEFQESGIHKAGQLEAHAAHAYLNRRHANIAERLAEELRKMKEEGLLKKFAQDCNIEY